DELAGLSPESHVFALRRQRPEVVRHMQASDGAIFAPKEAGGFSAAERAAAALHVATLLGDAVLIAHYRGRLAKLDPHGDPHRGRDEARWKIVLAHVERVTTEPDSARCGDLDRLLELGLSPHDIVALSQLIAYVNFQARVL